VRSPVCVNPRSSQRSTCILFDGALDHTMTKELAGVSSGMTEIAAGVSWNLQLVPIVTSTPLDKAAPAPPGSRAFGGSESSCFWAMSRR